MLAKLCFCHVILFKCVELHGQEQRQICITLTIMNLCLEPVVLEGQPGIEVLNDGWTMVTTDGKRYVVAPKSYDDRTAVPKPIFFFFNLIELPSLKKLF